MEFKNDSGIIGLALLGSISAFSIWSAANPSIFTISQFTTEQSKKNARLGMNIGLGLCGALTAGLYLAYGKKGTLPALLTGATGVGLYALYEHMLSTTHISNPNNQTMAQQAEYAGGGGGVNGGPGQAGGGIAGGQGGGGVEGGGIGGAGGDPGIPGGRIGNFPGQTGGAARQNVGGGFQPRGYADYYDYYEPYPIIQGQPGQPGSSGAPGRPGIGGSGGAGGSAVGGIGGAGGAGGVGGSGYYESIRKPDYRPIIGDTSAGYDSM